MDNHLLEQLLHTCTWCLNSIPKGDELFAFGVKASKAVDLTEKEGEFISLKLALKDKTIVALVTTPNSEVKEQGFDLIFVTCSQGCAEDLKDALEMERDVFKD
jgi:MinD superfamily P-loop ATPase